MVLSYLCAPCNSDVLDFLCVDENFDLSTASQYSIHFTIDQELIYTAFFADFGPLNIGLTYKFCQKLDALFQQANNGKSAKKITFYSSTHPHKKANAAVLLCAYLVSIISDS